MIRVLLLILLLSACSSTSAHTELAWRYVGPWQSISVDAGPMEQGYPVRRSIPPVLGASQSPSVLPSASTRPKSSPSGHLLPPVVAERGVATFYQYHRGQAAAGARLRDVLGDWRGMTVRVCNLSVEKNARCLHVVLSDFESSTIPGRLIDLSSQDFAAICGPLSRGICPVIVEREVSHGPDR